ncbi:MAG: DegV family protein [Clostridia bacterium]|nr:DegV family protein [Clostridia bacterium]
MNDNIVITSDSTTDLTDELKERYNIKVLPLGITLGDKVYRDGIDINPDDIYAHQEKTGELPKTTATNVGECIEFFEEFVKQGKTVIHFSLCSKMSSTYNNACIAASELENVYVIDTQNLSTGAGLLIISAAEMVKSGMNAKTVVEETNKLIDKVDTSFVLSSLEYLHKGGRCSALSVLGANLLKLKPCIEVKDGVMGVGKKYRGRYSDVVKQYVLDRIEDADDICLDRVFVTHSGCDMQLMEETIELVKNTLPFKEVFFARAGCTISSHCGPNTMGILFIRKTPIVKD